MIADQRGRVRRERAESERAAAIERITAATRALLREHTIFDLTSAVVADAAGTTRQTVHNYFPSMYELIFALADDLTVEFQTAGDGLDVDDPHWPYLYADRVADIALEDPIPNRQVLLVSASQGRGMAAATSETNRQIVPALKRRNPVAADKASWLTMTLFRGTLFSWGAEQLSAEELRENLRDVADVVVAQRGLWLEEV
ncbi:MAG: TetR/AcrR family transcriptional regulator [Acidimicrobiales bacterium]|nr:TetR/AcrR family transcriptional regulator [Acidimicrobiales bacterium]